MDSAATSYAERQPRLLDLFCGAGGAAKGYQRAGFYVVGVDEKPQPNYCGDDFIQYDALDYLCKPDGSLMDWANGFDAIHASPPCQTFTAYRRKGYGVGDGYLNLIPQTRELLQATGLPYIIENVEQAGYSLRDPVMLCGSMFGLDVRRHRLFETNWPLSQISCRHADQQKLGKRFPGATNRNGRYTVEVGVWRIPLGVQQEAMGMDWSSLEELSEAVPPAYTEYVGAQLIDALESWGQASATRARPEAVAIPDGMPDDGGVGYGTF